jgi:hypothetical protein
MSGPTTNSTSSLHADPRRKEQISAETIERCAQLLAAGEMDWPQDFSTEQEADLLTAVRRCRRARLVKFIASRIAADLASEAKGRAKEAQS